MSADANATTPSTTPADAVRTAAADIQDGAALLSQGYQALLPALDVYRREVYRTGGADSVTDFIAHAGPDRVRSDLVALLVAAGLGDVLVVAAGRKDQKPLANFYTRYKQLVASGDLTASRGPANTGPLSAYPDAKVIR